MTNKLIFDIRQSNFKRTITRIVIMLIKVIVFIGWGYYLLPTNFSLVSFNLSDLELWDGWTLISFALISSGIFTLLKEANFAFHSLGNTKGEWHFSLINAHLVWNVPNHFHGNEIGFSANLSEIKEIEFRTINRHEDTDLREYWVHFYEREAIQLQSYSGFTVSSIVSKICNEGVEFNKTQSYQ